MVTEIILIIFAIIYYLFSVFFIATALLDINDYSIWGAITTFLIAIMIAPIIVPIILGIGLGEWIKNN